MTLFAKANQFLGLWQQVNLCYSTSSSTILIIVLVGLLQQSAYGVVYIHNETYPTLQGLFFGRFMEGNRLYQAHLQFLSKNP